MNLNLTTNSYEKMTDTNKLLYLVLGELQGIREALNKSRLNEQVFGDSEGRETKQNSIAGQIEGNQAKAEGFTCKYCGEVVEGNRGNLLAHIRQCSERKKGSG